MRKYLIKARKKKGFTHEHVADQSKITRQYYGMIEKGERTPSVSIAKRIGEVLEIDWTIFFEPNSNLRLRKDEKATSIS
ncbi:helix-turn-helix transcriptional regulator [Sutcliffiella horikoshii]|uniref:helix-turn-helix transcriptional regulator n=1 Tax=Sutcliffiella horikoshii TaxID=79883 RepID=UPI003CF25913